MSMDCSVACGGRCCKSFPMSVSPFRLGEIYQLSKGLPDQYSVDAVTICEMLIRTDQEDDEMPSYTCKHLEAGGLCGIYEQRPKMCREYPYGGACDHCGVKNPDYVQLK